MKEITRIHLAKTPYNIEVDARKILQTYLADIEKRLQTNDDTMTEIEARIVELLTEAGVINEKVITVSDIDTIRQKLGEPNEFIDSDEESVPVEDRRLMRDTSSGMLGGVLAGIAGYYGFNVIWLRLATIILGFVSFGTAFVVYLVLWIIMPATNSVADRLQLYGQRVTPAEIKRYIDTFTFSNESKKPLILILRAMLGLLWLGAIFAAIVLLILGLGASTDYSTYYGSANILSGWILAMIGLLIVSGVSFIIFCSIAAYASFTWKMNKRIAVSLSILTVLGILAFAAAIGSGMYGQRSLENAAEQQTYTTTISADEKFSSVKKLVVEGGEAKLIYVVRAGEPSVKIRSIVAPINQKAVQIKVNETTATVQVHGDAEACKNLAYGCKDVQTEVTIYGPALESITVENELKVEYAASAQDTLAVNIKNNAFFNLSVGQIKSINMFAGSSSSISLTDGTVSKLDVSLANNTDIYLGNIDTLNITSQGVCPENGESDISVESLRVITHNGVPMNESFNDGEINDTCLEVTVENLG